MSNSTPLITDAPDARQPGETLPECVMRLWAPHAAMPIRTVEREAAARLDREGARK